MAVATPTKQIKGTIMVGRIELSIIRILWIIKDEFDGDFGNGSQVMATSYSHPPITTDLRLPLIITVRCLLIKFLVSNRAVHKVT
jgi:hypothetical protein